MSDSAGSQPKAPLDTPPVKRRSRFSRPFLPRWIHIRRHRTATEHRSQVARMELSNAALSIISTTLGLATAILSIVSYNATQAKQAAETKTEKVTAKYDALAAKMAESDANTPDKSRMAPLVTPLEIELSNASYVGTGVSLDNQLVDTYVDAEFEYLKDSDTRKPTLKFNYDIKKSIRLAYASKAPTREECAGVINRAPTDEDIDNLAVGTYICVRSFAKAIVLLEVTKAPDAADPSLHLTETYWAD